MPNNSKVKPSWICQHCSRPFTTKYSLMRHFKRFPEHSPPNLHDGSDSLKPVTVTLKDGARTVQAGPSVIAQTTSISMRPQGEASPPSPQYKPAPRRVSTGSTTEAAQPAAASSDASAGEPKQEQQMTDVSTSSLTAPPHSHSQPLPTVPVVEQTPSTPSHHHLGTPISSSGQVITGHPGQVVGGSNNGGVYDDATATTKGHFPFLPPFLEEEQILSIATPQNKHAFGSPLHSYPPSSSSVASTPVALPPHMGAGGTLQSPLWHGENMLSPLAPACNIGQVFAQENLHLHFNSNNDKMSSSDTTAPAVPTENYSPPVSMEDLDNSLLVGMGEENEVTSPLNFLEKTSSMSTSSLDFLSPPSSAYQHPPRHHHHHHRPPPPPPHAAAAAGGHSGSMDFTTWCM